MVVPNSRASGCKSRGDSGARESSTTHTYVGPGHPVVTDRRVIVTGGYGGLGLVLEGDRWPGPPMAYEMTDGKARLTQRHIEVSLDLENVVRSSVLSAAVYTQTTDIESGVNELLTYDGQVVKPDLVTSRGPTVSPTRDPQSGIIRQRKRPVACLH